MSIKSFFTAFHDSFSDVKTYYDFKKELGMRLVEDEFFNALEGKKVFNAFVLQISSTNPTRTSNKTTGGGYTVIKVRPIDLHDSFIPEPCMFKTAKFQREIVDMHPSAFSEGIGLTNSFAVGDTVECYFDEQGPEYEGMMRGLRFRDNAQARSVGHYKFDCLQNYQAERSKSVFDQSPGSRTVLKDQARITRRENVSQGGEEFRNVNRTIIFENIKFKTNESVCRPANPNSESFFGYLGQEQYDLYKSILGQKESGNKYDEINLQGFSGKYQFSFYNMYKYHKVIKEEVWNKFSAGKSSAYKNQFTKASQKEVNRLLNDTNSWTGLGGVVSKETFGDPNIGGPVQERGQQRFSTSYFKRLKQAGLFPDLNNVVHVVALMTSAHLKGVNGAKLLASTKPNNDDPDGNGFYPSWYYVDNGKKFMNRCSK